MNNFFTHPMRPFFVGAAILAIVGALSFFISPDDLILHRKIFLEFMLPAAIRRLSNGFHARMDKLQR